MDSRARRPAGRDALGRRAADARARARADGAAAAADARRAVARARAADRARDLPHRARAEREGGAHGARRRAGRAHRARRASTRVRARGRDAWPSRGRAPSCARTSPSGGATSGTDGRLPAAGRRRGSRRAAIYGVARARARPHPPRDGGHQLRAGRDGDVLDVHRLDADDEPRLAYWPAFAVDARRLVRRRRRRSTRS